MADTGEKGEITQRTNAREEEMVRESNEIVRKAKVDLENKRETRSEAAPEPHKS